MGEPAQGEAEWDGGEALPTSSLAPCNTQESFPRVEELALPFSGCSTLEHGFCISPGQHSGVGSDTEGMGEPSLRQLPCRLQHMREWAPCINWAA